MAPFVLMALGSVAAALAIPLLAYVSGALRITEPFEISSLWGSLLPTKTEPRDTAQGAVFYTSDRRTFAASVAVAVVIYSSSPTIIDYLSPTSPSSVTPYDLHA